MSSDESGPAPGEVKVENEIDAGWTGYYGDGHTEDVVDDEGDGELKTVGEPSIVVSTQPERVTEEWCATIREALAGDVYHDEDWRWSRQVVTKHARGDCSHEIDASPLEYDDTAQEWAVAEAADEPDAEWIPVDEVDLETLDRLKIDYEVRQQVRVIGGGLE